MSSLVKQTGFLVPTSIGDAIKNAEYICKSDFVPQAYKNKPADIVVAWAYGAEIGLSPMQSLQDIAVIRGKPTLWGDGMLALVQAHPDCEWVNERLVPVAKGNGDDTFAECTIKRKGYPERTYTFSVADAKKAGLWGKSGPWRDYPKRMLQMRARGFALRDMFSDALKGFKTAEEVMDYKDNVETPQKRTSRPVGQPVVTIEQRKERVQEAVARHEIGRIEPKKKEVAIEAEIPPFEEEPPPIEEPELHSNSEVEKSTTEAVQVVKEVFPEAEVLPELTLWNDWKWKVESADSLEELAMLAEEAKRLPEQFKSQARSLFVKCRSDLENAK